MADDKGEEYVVPVVNEEVHADAIPVQTGGVRVTKHVEGHDEILEQELRRGRVEIKRVKTDRVVDGPQQVQRVGNTLVVPVVSEVLSVQKQWVVTEEIHITQIEELETVQQKVRVNEEQAEVERLDQQGNVVSSVEPPVAAAAAAPRSGSASIVNRGAVPPASGDANRVLSSSKSLLKDRPQDKSKNR
jgi:stress response protein YsnF